MKIDKLTFYYNDNETASFERSAKTNQWKLCWTDKSETAETLVEVVIPLLAEIAELFNDLPHCEWQREGDSDAEAVIEDLHYEFNLEPLEGENLAVAGVSSFAFWED